VARRTGERFRGGRLWRVELRPGARYRYGAGGSSGGWFAVSGPAA
jgi:hypothetical protein